MQRSLGKYELLARLATGGMAEVYLARERGLAGLERFVVIKRMLPQLEEEPEHIEMFLREARFIARLNHPNIIQIYELGEAEGSYFFAMEYLDGISLAELMALLRNRGERLPLELTVEIIAQACRGAHAAHEARDFDGALLGLVHRDMTPHNLMVTGDGHVKLLDFGVAKASHGQERTDSGSIKGKYTYMSPEQARNETLDRRSDIFALGVILWELCTGTLLFSRVSVLDALNAIAGGEIQRPSEVEPDIEPGVEAVIMKALAARRADRFDTADALREALQAAFDALPEGREHNPERLSSYLEAVAGEALEERRRMLSRRREKAATDSTFDLPGLAYEDMTASEPAFEPTVTSGQHPSASVSSDDIGAADTLEADQAEAMLEEARTRAVQASEVPDLPRARDSRRAIAVVGIVVLLAAVAVAAWMASRSAGGEVEEGPGGEGGAELSGPPVTVGWPPLLDAELLLRDVEPLHAYLEEQLGRPVEARVSSDYETLSAWLLEGEVDFAVLPPLLYVETKAKEPDVRLLALKEFDGVTSSMALLLVPMNSTYQSVEELEGRRFCYTDRSSTSGYLMPRAFLRDQGRDPDAFVGAVQWSGNHFQALRDLLDGRCDVAATFSSSVLPADRYDIAVGQLRTLAVTGKIPEDSVCAGPDVAPERVDAMRDALLAFDPERAYGSRAVSETQRITGFVEATEDDFASVRAAIPE